MTAKEKILEDARRQVRLAVRSARYALNRLVSLADYTDDDVLVTIAADAERTLEDGVVDARLATAAFRRAELM